MMFPGNPLFRLLSWIIRILGLELELNVVIDPVDEREVSDELHYGRD